MATAHKVMVTVAQKNGRTKVFPYSTTDLNTAFFIAPSGSDGLVFSANPSYIVDLIHSTQGTCTKVYVYFDDVLQPLVLFTAAGQPTVNRQVRSQPIAVPGGTRVKFQTIT